MKKIKQILAILAIAVMVICALLTLIFALLTNFGVGDFSTAWKASAWCMVVIPCFLYAMLLIYKVLNKNNK
ncbi:MAG: hypothetical protein ACLRZ9_02450 [Eubacterium sp.]